jgi:iron(III) transport system substrate-binding protein
MKFSHTTKIRVACSLGATIVFASALSGPSAAATRSTTTKVAKATAKKSSAKAPTTKPNPTTKRNPTTGPSSTQVTTKPTVRSKKLTVYSGRNERLIKPLLQAFEQETGIELEVRYADSSQLAATLIEESDRTKADVFFSQDAGALGALAKRGLLAPLPSATLNKVNKAYRASAGNWVGVSGRARVFAYDPRQISNPPESIDEIVDPKWKGKIGFVPTNASWHSFVTALREVRGEDGARKWLAAFKSNSPRVYSGNAAALQGVEKGDVAISLVNHYYLYELATGDLSKVKTRNAFAKPGDPGALVNVAGAAILKDAGNDSAAQDFVAFLLSKDAQIYFATQTYEYPLISTVSPAKDLPPLQSFQSPITDLSDLDTIEASLKLLREVGLL